MQDTGKTLCPICAKELPRPASLCWNCGSDLHGMKLEPPKSGFTADHYEIVPDGSMFGIALRGEIKIHGLDSQKAQKLLSILNMVI